MQMVRTRSTPTDAAVEPEAADAPSGPSPGAGEAEGPGSRPPKAARLARGLGEWATQQVLHENAQLRAQVASLQAEATWAEAKFRLMGPGTPVDLMRGLRMVQDFDVVAGGFPHQYIGRAEGDGEVEVTRFVSARKMLRISGRLLVALDPSGRLSATSPPALGGADDGAADGDDDAPAVPAGKTAPMNASVFGPNGVLYAISFVDSSSGELYTLQDYPGLDNGMAFLEWPNGDRARDHFLIGPNESAWTVRFRFPHIPHDRKGHVEWRLRFAPKNEVTRLRYPALSFETATFRACARVKDE